MCSNGTEEPTVRKHLEQKLRKIKIQAARRHSFISSALYGAHRRLSPPDECIVIAKYFNSSIRRVWCWCVQYATNSHSNNNNGPLDSLQILGLQHAEYGELRIFSKPNFD